VREEYERITYSMRIQGGAAAILKKAMKKMWDNLRMYRGEGVKPLLAVHDEVLWESPKSRNGDIGVHGVVENVVNWAFETAAQLRVPILAEGNWGQSWGEAKK